MCAYGLVSIRSAERCSSKRYLFIINMSINESPAVCVCVGDERGISFFFDGSRRGGDEDYMCGCLVVRGRAGQEILMEDTNIDRRHWPGRFYLSVYVFGWI